MTQDESMIWKLELQKEFESNDAKWCIPSLFEVERHIHCISHVNTQTFENKNDTGKF